MASFTPIGQEFDMDLLCAVKLSASERRYTVLQRKLKQIDAKPAAAKKVVQTLSKSREAPSLFLPLGLQGPPGLSLPDCVDLEGYPGLTQAPGLVPPCVFAPPGHFAPPGLAPPLGLTRPNGYKTGNWLKHGDSGSDGYIESDADDTSAGTGSFASSASSDHGETEWQTKEFQTWSNAPLHPYAQLKTPLRAPLQHVASPQEEWLKQMWLNTALDDVLNTVFPGTAEVPPPVEHGRVVQAVPPGFIPADHVRPVGYRDQQRKARQFLHNQQQRLRRKEQNKQVLLNSKSSSD